LWLPPLQHQVTGQVQAERFGGDDEVVVVVDDDDDDDDCGGGGGVMAMQVSVTLWR
jgi:hypothetical protein